MKLFGSFTAPESPWFPVLYIYMYFGDSHETQTSRCSALPKIQFFHFVLLSLGTSTNHSSFPWRLSSKQPITPGKPQKLPTMRATASAGAAFRVQPSFPSAGFMDRWKTVQHSASSKYSVSLSAGLLCPWQDNGRCDY